MVKFVSRMQIKTKIYWVGIKDFKLLWMLQKVSIH